MAEGSEALHRRTRGAPCGPRGTLWDGPCATAQQVPFIYEDEATPISLARLWAAFAGALCGPSPIASGSGA